VLHGGVLVPIELGWMRRELRRLALEQLRWRNGLDVLITLSYAGLRSAETGQDPEAAGDAELELLLAKERYAILQELRRTLVGSTLPPTSHDEEAHRSW